MTAPTIRCPLCEWTYTVPPLPAGVDETTLAGVFGPGVMLRSAINLRAADTEAYERGVSRGRPVPPHRSV